MKFFLGVLILATASVYAGTTVGSANTGNCYPFACNDSGTSTGQSIDYQQVYSSGSFSGTTSFSALTFFDSYIISQGFGGGPIIPGNYSINFYYSANPVNGLSASSPGANEGAFIGSFGDFNVTSPINFNPSYTFNGNSLTYNPLDGNLLMDIIVKNQANIPNGSGNGYMDADSSGSATSRAYFLSNGIAAADSNGLVTEFSGGSTGTPEPASFALVGLGLLGAALTRRKSAR